MSPSARWPWLLPTAILAHRVRRQMRWWRDALTGRVRWVQERSPDSLAYVVKAHASPLLRQLAPAEMHLQHGKATNLRLAAACVDGLLIRPGETVSFNREVGNATRRRGFADGMRISNGAAVAGVGGGLCQLANLMHWLALHSDLTVVERSEHSIDLFPDQERRVPWGVGCTIVYNYVDLVLRNDTWVDFQLRTWVDAEHLRGELRAASPQDVWAVTARAERFEADGADVVRRNELWRTRSTPDGPVEELIRRNRARVAYPVAAGLISR